MFRSNGLDKAVAIVFLALFGVCGLLGAAMTPFLMDFQKNAVEQMEKQDPAKAAEAKKQLAEAEIQLKSNSWMMPLQLALGALNICAGVGILIGRRWGLLAGGISCAISMLTAFVTLAGGSKDPKQLAFSLIGLALVFGFGAYFVFRWMGTADSATAPPA